MLLSFPVTDLPPCRPGSQLLPFIGSHLDGALINSHFIQNTIDKLKGISGAIGFSQIDTLVDHHLVRYFDTVEHFIASNAQHRPGDWIQILVLSVQMGFMLASISARCLGTPNRIS